MNKERLLAASRHEVSYQGAPCRTCKGTTRFVCNNTCTACAALASKKYRASVKSMLDKAKAGG